MSLLVRYRVIEVLKDDEAGTVQRAVDLLRGEEVILKQVSGLERDQEDLAREFVTLTRLRHPGLVRVLDFGAEPEGRCHLTMAPVPGRSLSQLERSLDGRELMELAADVAEALAYLHRRGVVHGDIKPDNIVIEARTGRPVLVDLGLARQPGQVASGGSLGYMAPEALAGEPVDHRSDLYSLGATLLGALTGSFGHPEDLGGSKIRTEAMCERHPDLPAPMADLLPRLLAPRPIDRPQSAGDLLEALGRDVVSSSFGELPLVGRSEQLEAVTDLFPKSGAGGVILVLGEAGIGKSRLLEELRWRAQARGHLVLEGRHVPGQELLDSPIVAMTRVLALMTGAPEYAVPGDASWSDDRLVELMEQTWRSLERGLSLHPVLQIDDVHLVGGRALELLAFMARAIEADGRALLVLTARPGPAADTLAQRAEIIDRISLPPLASAHVEALVEIAAETSGCSSVSAALIRSVRKASRGSPLVVTEICRELARRGWPSDLGRSALPRSAEEVTRAWVERLGSTQLRAVCLMTLLRRPMSRALARALALAEELETLAEHHIISTTFARSRSALAPSSILDDSLPSNERPRPAIDGVIDLGSRSLGIELRSPSLGEAAIATIDRSFRQRLHSELAEALQSEPGAEDEVIIHRVLAGGEVAEGEVLEAVDSLCRRCNFVQADELLAARFPDLDEKPQRWPEATARLAELASMAGQLRRAATLLRSLAGVQTGHQRGVALLKLARVEERAGAHLEAETIAREGMALVEDAEARSEACELLARIALMRSDYERVIHWTTEGLASPSGSRARLLSSRAAALLYLGDAEDALAAAMSGVEEASRAGDRRAEAVALGHAAMARAALGERRQSLELYRRSLDAAERGGDVASLPIYLLNLGTALDAMDEIGQALEQLRRAEAMAKRLGHRSSRVAALSNLGNLLSRIGAEVEARRVIMASVELARQSDMDLYIAQSDLLLAELEGRSQHLGPARDHIERAAAAFAKMNAKRQLDEVRLLRAELALLAADLDAASDALLAWSPPKDLEARHGVAAGRLSASRGRAEEARRLLTRAAELARTQDQRDIEAQAEHGLAGVLTDAGSPLAAQHRSRALELMTDLALKVPATYRESFWMVPHRAAIREGTAKEPWATRPNEDERAFRLLELNRRILAERDEGRLLDLALDIALELCGAERGFIILTETSTPRVVAARNIDRETIRKPRWKFSRSIAAEAASTGEPVLTMSAADDSRFTGARSVHNLGLQSILCVPIRTPERTLGTIYLDNRFLRGRFGPSDLRVALALADQAALALENARLHRENIERAQALEKARAELAARCDEQAQQVTRLEHDLRRSRELRHEYSAIIGRSPAMRRVLEVIDRVTESNLPVLIEGESGTGKELCARALHENSPRRHAPFVTINCSALPPSLLESELFGHVRGAFTGADRHRKGLFREAHGGTLFLDEVGDMPQPMQAKLLRVLQEGEVRSVGGDRTFKVDVRVIAATNRSLDVMAEAGLFRRDLMYRLAVVRVDMPPLSERREDLPELCDHLLKRAGKALGRPPKRLDRTALALLKRHPLPGNVRQLENILTEASLLTDSEVISDADLTIPELDVTIAATRRQAVEAYDRQMILDALADSGWNKQRAANALGISRPTLYRRMCRYDIPKQSPPLKRPSS